MMVKTLDRLNTTLFMAGVFHAVVILGITFETDLARKFSKTVPIVLVKTQELNKPKEADFLAQENQIGSGEAEEKDINREKSAVKPTEQTTENQKQQQQQLTKAQLQQALVQKEAEVAIDVENEEKPDTPSKLTAADLLYQNELEMARLEAEISVDIETYSRRPRKLHINSINAHQYKAASYEKAWQSKVERIGNLNYPGEVRRKKLSGTLVLTVELDKDGTLLKAFINHSSGHKAIDDAALYIVKLASPFSPFPLELQKDADVLVITRTWQFLNEGSFRTE